MSEFESHWMPLSYGLVLLHLSKKLCKLPIGPWWVWHKLASGSEATVLKVSGVCNYLLNKTNPNINSSSLSSHSDSMDFPDSLIIRPYNLSLPASFPNYILSSQRADVKKFLLVDQLWRIHVKGSIGERYLGVGPCLSRMSCLSSIVLEIGGKWPHTCCFEGCCFQDIFERARWILE